MRRILAVTVGGEPDPVVQAIRQHAPDFVLFFVTTEPAGGSRRFLVETTEKGEPLLQRAGLPPEAYEIITLPRPDDFADCFQRMREALREHAQDAERIADYTGGTKTMSAALVAAALLSGWSLSVVGGERRDTVKVARGTELARLVHAAPFYHELVLAQVRRLYESHEYASAAAVLQAFLTRSELHGTDQQRLTHLHTFLKALAAWDRFAYAEALELLRAVGGLWPQGCALLARIWDEKEGALGEEAVADLFGNALRRAEQGRFEDAALRLYRAVELWAQLSLKHRYHQDTSNLNLDDPRFAALPSELQRRLQERREKEGRAWVGLVEAYELLVALDDPVGRVFQEGWNERLKDLLSQRNRLFLTHGLVPVSQEDWERAHSQTRKFLEEAHRALGRRFEPVAFPRWEDLNL